MHEHGNLDDIERNDLLQELLGVILDAGAGHQAAGVVDEHVDAAERRLRFADDALDVCDLGDVATDQHGLAAQRAYVGRDLFRCVAARVVVHDDMAAEPREGARRRCADPRRRAGDENCLAFEIGCHEVASRL